MGSQRNFSTMILNYYQYFYQVALIGNITKAAKTLYISQPALSKAISNLETQLNCQLFERTPKGVSLTLEGELLFQSVKETYSILNDTKNRINSIQKKTFSEIRIGVGRDVFENYLLPRLKKFYTDYPSSRFRVDILSSELIATAINDNLLDIGITTQPMDGVFFLSQGLFQITDCFVAGDKYKQLAASSHSIYELINYFPIIMLPKKSLTRKHMDAYLQSYGLVATPIHEVQDTKLILQMVAANFGIGYVTENFVQNAIEKQEVFKIPIIEVLPSRTVTLTWSNHRPLSNTAKVLLHYLK